MLSKQQSWHVGIGLIGIGVCILAGSIWLHAGSAWIGRMAAVLLLVSGIQFQPKLADWLEIHSAQRVILGTLTGISLVWMLIQYSRV